MRTLKRNPVLTLAVVYGALLTVLLAVVLIAGNKDTSHPARPQPSAPSPVHTAGQGAGGADVIPMDGDPAHNVRSRCYGWTRLYQAPTGDVVAVFDPYTCGDADAPTTTPSPAPLPSR